MENRGFIAYLFQTMLHEYFHTKAQMANALGVQLRTLRYNFKNLDRSKGASALALLEAALHLTGNAAHGTEKGGPRIDPNVR